MSGGFRRGRESRFQGLQLFGFDGGPRPAALPDGALLVDLSVVFVGQMSRFGVLAVVLRVLGVRRQTRVAARRDCVRIRRWTLVKWRRESKINAQKTAEIKNILRVF